MSLKSEMTKLKQEARGFRYYLLGATPSRLEVHKYHSDNLTDLFNKLYAQNRFSEHALEGFWVEDTETDTTTLVVPEEDMLHLVAHEAYYYSLFEEVSPLTDVVTSQEAAIILGIKDRSVRANCEKGKYNARKAGGTWLIERDSLGRIK
jgi:hypothetical protein